MNQPQRGFSLIEILGALAIASALLVGLSQMVTTSLEDTEGQQAGLYQAQVVEAAGKYIAAHYDELKMQTEAGLKPSVPVYKLIEAELLSPGFALKNPYGQDTCVLVRKAGTGKFNVLIATYGGKPILDRHIAIVAATAGQ